MEKLNLWKRLKTIFLISLGVIIVGGILYYGYQGTKNVYVDNPTDTELSVQFDDGETVKIPAKTLEQVPCKAGKHTLTVNGKEMWEFEKKATEFLSFVNPSNQVYIKEYIIYIADDVENKDEFFDKLPNNTIELNGQKVVGPFEKVEGIYLKKDWNYGITVEEPESVSIAQGKQYIIETKLYRYNDFVTMYNENYAED